MKNRSTETFRRVSKIVRRDVGSTTFLVDPRRNVIHQLNSVGAAVWQLLVNPATRDNLTDLLHAAFPGVDRDVIEQDLDELLSQLQDAELVAQCEPERPVQELTCESGPGR